MKTRTIFYYFFITIIIILLRNNRVLKWISRVVFSEIFRDTREIENDENLSLSKLTRSIKR